MKLKDKRIVVTGGTKGLGRALLDRFVAEGARVATCARTAKDVDAIRQAFPPGSLFPFVCDISNSHDVEGFVAGAVQSLGTVDVLVNNASRLGTRVPVAEYSLREWDDTIQTNINGPFFITRLIIPLMAKRGSGCIINVSSSVGRAARRGWGAYAVSKFALEGLTQLLADELRPFNIRVNSVNPGPMSTDMRKAAYPDEDHSKLRSPGQLTDLFVYLASQDGVGMSGQAFDASTYIANPQIVS